MKNLAKAATKVFYGVGLVYCAIFFVVVSVFADDAPAQADVAENAAVASEAAQALEDGGQPINERAEMSRKVRQLHANWIKARAEAAKEDPEIDRLQKRVKALESEIARMRAEIDGRTSEIPLVRAAREEYEAAQKQLEEMNAKFRSGGARGQRVINRKPVAGVPAVQETRQEAGAVESAVGSGE